MKTTRSAALFFFMFLLHLADAPFLMATQFHNMGRHYYTTRDFEKAREMFLKDIEIQKNGPAYYFLGEIEKNNGNFEKSEEYFNEAVKLVLPQNYRKNAYWNLIVISEQRGDFGSTILYCKKMANEVSESGAREKAESIINKSLWSNNAEAIEHYKKGIAYKKQGELKKGEEYLHKALEADPAFMAVRFEIGSTHYQAGNESKALEYIIPVIKAIPFHPEANIIAGDIYYSRRDYRNAGAYFLTALKYGFLDTGTENMLRLKRGSAMYQSGDYPEAEEEFRELVRRGESNQKILTLLSATLIKQGKESEAIQYLTQIQKSDPNNQSLLLQIGSIYYRKSDDRYLEYFNRLFESCSGKSQCHEKYSRAFEILLKKYYDRKDNARFIQVFSGMNGDSLSPEIRGKAAQVYFEQRNFSKAAALFESISRKKNEELLLVKSHIQAGNTARAREHITRLLKRDGFQKSLLDDPVSGPLTKRLIDEKKAATPSDEKTK